MCNLKFEPEIKMGPACSACATKELETEVVTVSLSQIDTFMWQSKVRESAEGGYNKRMTTLPGAVPSA